MIKEKKCQSIVQQCWNAVGEINIVEKMVRCCLKLEEWRGGFVKEMRVQLERCRKELKRLRSRRDVLGIQSYNKIR